eukprot:6318107-Prymnesium_polylepis.1
MYRAIRSRVARLPWHVEQPTHDSGTGSAGRWCALSGVLADTSKEPRMPRSHVSEDRCGARERGGEGM